jgi:hypothetical protein
MLTKSGSKAKMTSAFCVRATIARGAEAPPTNTRKVTDMKPIDALRVLWDAGYAVAAFTPEELRGADPDRVADLMCEHGWYAIDSLNYEENE